MACFLPPFWLFLTLTFAKAVRESLIPAFNMYFTTALTLLSIAATTVTAPYGNYTTAKVKPSRRVRASQAALECFSSPHTYSEYTAESVAGGCRPPHAKPNRVYRRPFAQLVQYQNPIFSMHYLTFYQPNKHGGHRNHGNRGRSRAGRRRHESDHSNMYRYRGTVASSSPNAPNSPCSMGLYSA